MWPTRSGGSGSWGRSSSTTSHPSGFNLGYNRARTTRSTGRSSSTGAIYGSFRALHRPSLIEHYAGNFPVWLAARAGAPSCRWRTTSSRGRRRSTQRLRAGRTSGSRSTRAPGESPLKARIRDAQVARVPYTFVIGSKEVEGQGGRGAAKPRGGQGRGPRDAAVRGGVRPGWSRKPRFRTELILIRPGGGGGALESRVLFADLAPAPRPRGGPDRRAGRAPRRCRRPPPRRPPPVRRVRRRGRGIHAVPGGLRSDHQGGGRRQTPTPHTAPWSADVARRDGADVPVHCPTGRLAVSSRSSISRRSSRGETTIAIDGGKLVPRIEIRARCRPYEMGFLRHEDGDRVRTARRGFRSMALPPGGVRLRPSWGAVAAASLFHGELVWARRRRSCRWTGDSHAPAVARARSRSAG